MSNKTCMSSLKPANSFFYLSNTRTFLTLFCTVKLESTDIKILMAYRIYGFGGKYSNERQTTIFCSLNVKFEWLAFVAM